MFKESNRSLVTQVSESLFAASCSSSLPTLCAIAALLFSNLAAATDEVIPADTVWGAYGGGPPCDPPAHVFPGVNSALQCLIASADQKIEYTGEIVAKGPGQPNEFWFPARIWDNFPNVPKVYSYSATGAFAAPIPSCPLGYLGPNFNSADATWSCKIQVVTIDQTQKSCDLCVGNPIFPGIGNKRQEETDYVGVGVNPLTFSRIYNSAPQFGSTWKHNFNRSITYSAAGSTFIATINRPEGSYAFKANGLAWVADADVNYKLGGGNGSFVVTTPNGDQEIYDTFNQLSSIYNASSTASKYTLTYNSGSAHLLNRVSDSFGHSLSFTYDAQNRLATMIDPDGKLYQYTYDGNGNISSVTYPDGKVRTYVYNEPFYTTGANLPHALTGIIDESNVRFANFGYNAAGLAVLSEHAGGADRYAVTYGSLPTVLSEVFIDVPNHIKHVTLYYQAPAGVTVADALGATRGYGFTTVNGIVKTTGSSALCIGVCTKAPQAQAFDVNGNVTSKTDFNGTQTVFGYDLSRNLETSRTEAYGTANARTITTQWHATFRVPTMITEPGRTTTFSYDSNGILLSKTIVDTNTNATRVWTYTYGSAGQMLTNDGPRTDVLDKTTYAYYGCTSGYECGQLRTVTDALGHVTTFNAYNANGQPLTITDVNGALTTLAYDSRQRLSARTIAGETTSFFYYATGLLQQVVLPDGSFLNYVYDGAHRLTEIDDSLGNRMVYTLDAMGNRTAENLYDPSGALTRTRTRLFNSLGQLWKDLTASGSPAQTTMFGYDGNGNQTTVAAPLSRNAVNAYDELNRLKQVTDANNGTTQYRYDTSDNLISVTDPRGLQTTYSYNGLGDLQQLASPDTGTTTNTFDSAGNLATTTDARNKTATYTYDALNRVTRVTYPDQTITYTYDVGSDAVGRLSSVTDSSGSTSWTYTPQGRVASKTQTTGSKVLTVSYGYDANGQRTTVTTPSGKTIAYTYSNNQIASVNVNSVTVLSSVLYEPFGPTAGWTWGNGTLAVRSYDTDGNISQLDSAGFKTFGYDDAFRVTNITDQDDGVNSWNYSYDLLDRLTSATGSQMQSFTFDANGNRLTQGGSASSAFTVSSTNNRLSSVNGALSKVYSYDNSGNISSDGTISYTYSAAGRMTSVTKAGVTTTYAYNAFGERVSKTTGGSTTYFVYDESGHLLGEYDNTGAVIQEIAWMDDTPVASIRLGSCGLAVFYIHTDHLNTPRRVTKRSTNEIVWRWESDAFGATAANENPSNLGTFTFNLRFPGQYYDQETGLHYNYYRDYDPQTGRYVESDPIGLSGGVNTYVYVGGSPLTYDDPYGLLWQFGDPLPDWLVDGAAGFGDNISFGLSDYLRGEFQIGSVDKCSAAYMVGDYAADATSLLGGGGLIGKSLIKRGGTEFSHWIPERYIRQFSKGGRVGKDYKAWLDNPIGRAIVNSPLNGNYATQLEHRMSDPKRQFPGLTNANRRWSFPRQQLNRFPGWISGAAFFAQGLDGLSQCGCN